MDIFLINKLFYHYADVKKWMFYGLLKFISNISSIVPHYRDLSLIVKVLAYIVKVPAHPSFIPAFIVKVLAYIVKVPAHPSFIPAFIVKVLAIPALSQPVPAKSQRVI